MSRRQKIERIERALFKAYAKAPEPQMGPMWRQGVMRDIRLDLAKKNLNAPENHAAAFTNLMFKFAGAGAAVGFALLFYVLQTDTGLDAEAARSLIQDPLSVVPLDTLFWS